MVTLTFCTPTDNSGTRTVKLKLPSAFVEGRGTGIADTLPISRTEIVASPGKLLPVIVITSSGLALDGITLIDGRGIGVGTGVSVGIGVDTGVLVGIGVDTGVWVGIGMGNGVGNGVGTGGWVGVSVATGVLVGVGVGTGVWVGVGARLGTEVGVKFGVEGRIRLGDAVVVGVGSWKNVGADVGVSAGSGEALPACVAAVRVSAPVTVGSVVGRAVDVPAQATNPSVSPMVTAAEIRCCGTACKIERPPNLN